MSKDKSKREFKKHFEFNDNYSTTYQKWNKSKAALIGKFITINAFTQKEHSYKMNDLHSHFKKLEK